MAPATPGPVGSHYLNRGRICQVRIAAVPNVSLHPSPPSGFDGVPERGEGALYPAFRAPHPPLFCSSRGRTRGSPHSVRPIPCFFLRAGEDARFPAFRAPHPPLFVPRGGGRAVPRIPCAPSPAFCSSRGRTRGSPHSVRPIPRFFCSSRGRTRGSPHSVRPIPRFLFLAGEDARFPAFRAPHPPLFLARGGGLPYRLAPDSPLKKRVPAPRRFCNRMPGRMR
jgi:hypothetical protein